MTGCTLPSRQAYQTLYGLRNSPLSIDLMSREYHPPYNHSSIHAVHAPCRCKLPTTFQYRLESGYLITKNLNPTVGSSAPSPDVATSTKYIIPIGIPSQVSQHRTESSSSFSAIANQPRPKSQCDSGSLITRDGATAIETSVGRKLLNPTHPCPASSVSE